MNEVEKLVHTLDVQMTEMRKNLDMLQSMVVEKKERSINLKSLEEYAHNKKFTGHILHQYSQEEAYHYCCMLASAVLLSNDEKKKSRQYFFLFRLYHTFFDQEIHEELLRDSQMISMKEWEKIAKNYDSDLMDHLLTDMLLMISLDGSPEQKQLEYFSETAAYLLPDVERTKAYFGVVRAILSMDEGALLEMAKVIDINEFYPYLGKKSSYYIVSDVAEIKKIKAKKIRIYRGEFSNYDGVWDLDQYKGKELFFDQCQFIKIEGIKGYEVKTKFEQCEFKECGISLEMTENNSAVKNSSKASHSSLIGEVAWHKVDPNLEEPYRYPEGKKDYYFMDMHNTTIINCNFEQCKVEGGDDQSGLIRIESSKMCSCQFSECNVGIHAGYPKGAVIVSIDSTIEKCLVQNCTIYGEGNDTSYHQYYEIDIVKAFQGTIKNNLFKNCMCDYRKSGKKARPSNYILTYDENCIHQKNSYEDCKTEQDSLGLHVSNDMENAWDEDAWDCFINKEKYLEEGR